MSLSERLVDALGFANDQGHVTEFVTQGPHMFARVCRDCRECCGLVEADKTPPCEKVA
jgi:hypothetical protein